MTYQATDCGNTCEGVQHIRIALNKVLAAYRVDEVAVTRTTLGEQKHQGVGSNLIAEPLRSSPTATSDKLAL